LIYRRVQNKTNDEIDDMNITPSDYSVIVDNLPEGENEN